MANQREVDAFAAQMSALSVQAQRALRAELSGVDMADGARVRAILASLWPDILQIYGDSAVGLASDFFEEWALSMGVVPKLVASTENLERDAARMRWASIQPAAMANLVGILDELVKNRARETMQVSAQESGLRFARVPTGAKTCAFCRMLASRGAVYLTRQSASMHAGAAYHGHCSCVPVPVRGPQDYPSGYDPDEYLDEYLAARRSAGSSDASKVLAKMRATRKEG